MEAAALRRFYGKYIRWAVPPFLRVALKYVYGSWGYRRVFTISTLSFRERWKLYRRFMKVDCNVRHGHWPCEMAYIAKMVLEQPPTSGGAIVEAGCWQGGSTAKLSILCEMRGLSLEVYDSFEGVEATDQEGYDFSGEYAAELELVQQNIVQFGEIGVCRFHRGWFRDTIARNPVPVPVQAAYIDCDLAKGTVEVLQGVLPSLSDNGLIFSQDYHIRPVRRVLEQESTWEHLGVSSPRIAHLCHHLAVLRF